MLYKIKSILRKDIEGKAMPHGKDVIRGDGRGRHKLSPFF